MENCYRIEGNTLILKVKAVPGASKTEWVEVKEGQLRVRIAAAAEDGKANEALRLFLAKTLKCPKKEITLQAGEKSRLKTLVLPLSYKETLEDLVKRY
ncbi:MAG: DUF167 domain-containing protein [Spirochaetaceae bacterium]|jgi:uncharacterized protein (TIGR00251 family)|nr:DUF167 domain-containing protein [Spirochaetaceae bacterium]